ncbi:LysR family transcriptional regulator [Rhodobacteraceae bacterium CY05]|uniref:LysR family transcriptional regulator n=2 Tax=Parasedimentitalea huanghaiensis TaxID=2682100 RepID=A0A6L6WKF1_9RHOB|nr:LysR family transcriptional regulator [Zongyanglinia huanghaiensis]
MDSWDDIRFFLAVARSGSVRGASVGLGVNHSTVLRRVSNLEAQLGALLFEKLPSGYKLTPAGEEILDLAISMDEDSSLLQTRVFARDQNLTGPLRVALPPSLASELLMPDFVAFTQLHPEIELQIVTSYEAVNLTTRQADLAIRLVYDQLTLPQHLFGTRLQNVHRSVYISRELQNRILNNSQSSARWILKEEDGPAPSWAANAELETGGPPINVSDMASQLSAVRAGMGVTILPCFVGDLDRSLARAPGSINKYYGTLWVLTHGETRKTKRVRLFSEFIKARIAVYSALLSGEAYIDDASKGSLTK